MDFISKEQPTPQEFVDLGSVMADEDQAEYARQLLANPLFKFILASMEKELTELWLNSQVHENESREDIHKTIKILQAFKKRVETCLSWAINKEQNKKLKLNLV